MPRYPLAIWVKGCIPYSTCALVPAFSESFYYMERRVDLKLTALKHLINDQVGILGVPKFITSISLKDNEVERSVMCVQFFRFGHAKGC